MNVQQGFHITLAHHAALGDTVLLIPLIQSLRMRWPDCRITLVTRPAFGELLQHLGHIHAWYSADAAEHTAWFGTFDAAWHRLPPAWAECDLLISAVSNGDDSWSDHARAAMVGRADRLHFFEPRPPADFNGHVTQWHRLALRKLELQAPVLPMLSGNENGPILIHPGSGGAAKCWPIDRFMHLADRLSEQNRRVEFIMGEVELERWPRETVEIIRSRFTCHIQPSLIELAQRIRQSRAWIGNDSGPTHLAASMGVPGIALFGPSHDKQWRPVGHFLVIRAGSDLRALPVEQALYGITRLLGE